MSQIDERQRSINAKLERLRKRLRDAKATGTLNTAALVGILSGVIDLLEDEL